MRAALIFGSLFSLILLAGCGDSSGPAEPVADVDEITTWAGRSCEGPAPRKSRYRPVTTGWN